MLITTDYITITWNCLEIICGTFFVYIEYFYVIQPTYTPKYTRNFMQYKLVYFETKKNNNKKQHNYVGYRVVFVGCEHTILHIIREVEWGRV